MPNRSLQISPDALYQEIAGEAVILDLGSSTYFGLDAVGVRVWQLLQDTESEQAVVATMQAEYDAAPADLQRDIDKFIDSLVEAGLVRVVTA